MRMRVDVILLSLTSLAVSTACTVSMGATETWQNEWTILVNYEEKHPHAGGHPPMGWIPGELGPDFVNRPCYEGEGARTGFLALHPLDEEEPAKIGFKGRVFLDTPVLVVEASGCVKGDFVLQCVVNGKSAGKTVLDGSKWTTAEFDLSQFAGEPLKLELWNVPGGKKSWAWEHCYIDKIYFKGKTHASEDSTLITDGLILDLDADKDVTLEDGDRVTHWKNQVAEFPAQNFAQRDKGRDIPGSGRPTLKENIAELSGHNSLVFREDELINMDQDAFDHLITGSGYTWFTVMKAYTQVGKLKDVNVFFGNLNCDCERKCEGFWAGFEDDSVLWTGPRNGITFGRYNADNPKLRGPRFAENKYYVVAGRLAGGTGTVITDVFVESPVPYASAEFPVNPNADASVMAIGTERDAWQHPGQESFDGELARVLMYERALTDEEMAQMMSLLKAFYFGCRDQKSDKFDSDGSTKLRVGQDEAAGIISVFRADGKDAIITQNDKPNFRPFLHPIVAPDGKGVLTEYRPVHHKHQTGLYCGFTRVNGQAVSEDILKEWFYRQDKPKEIARVSGRDYFHHPGGDYWQRVSASVLQAAGEEVIWQTVYNMLDDRGNTILTETQRWSMREQNGKYLLNLEWNRNAKTDVTIDEFDYGGLFLRMPWREGIKGEAVNYAGQINEQAEGQRASWVDVAMQVEGREDLAHIAIFDHPSNGGYPQPWRVDEQLGVGPVRARLGDWKIEKGKTETIRHQIVAYTGEHSDIELTKLWGKYSR